MRPPSTPVLKKNNPNKWYIEFHYNVPIELWPYHKRKRERFKIYDDINRFKGEDREKYASERCQLWKHLIFVERYNPFEEELNELRRIHSEKNELLEKLRIQEMLSEEDRRKQVTIQSCLKIYLEEKKKNNKNTNSISTYSGTIKWISEYFRDRDLLDIPASKVTRLMISEAINSAKEKRKWSGTTFNKEIDFCMSVFNWLALEEYIYKNPAAGRIRKVKTLKTKHRWYDRDTAHLIKSELLKHGRKEVLNACEFTYQLCVRSQQELLKIKISDIDWDLKRFRFRAEVSKNKREEYRDINPAFLKSLKNMGLEGMPADWYIFGKLGVPGPISSGKNYLASKFKIVRDSLGLSSDFDIYGWKHTRVVHEMMKGSDPYQIQHLCRHSDLQETQNYMRDFDINLRNVYEPIDLIF